jgi:sugar phosphate isomerase/epimerase
VSRAGAATHDGAANSKNRYGRQDAGQPGRRFNRLPAPPRTRAGSRFLFDSASFFIALLVMKKIPLSLQLWSLRDDMRADFARTVGEVAKIGYEGVELAGYGNLDVTGVHAALTAAGLKVSGMHVGIGAIRSEPEKVIGDALLLGARHVTVPWWSPALFVSPAAAEQVGEELNAIGARFRAHGLQLSYHNHAGEFKLLDGRPAFDWILGAAEPRNLAAQVDVYWVQVGGYSPEKFLREQGARVPLVHLKDETELGLGPVDFDAVFAAVESVGAAEWYIVEQEKYNHPPLESIRRCFEQLKKWGKA